MVTPDTKSHVIAMLSENFAQGFEKLEMNVMAYPNDWLLWVKERNVQNSAGSICLFLLGNIAHCISLISTQEENSEWMIVPQSSRTELARAIATVKAKVQFFLASADDNQLDQYFPLSFRGSNVSTCAYLIHLLAQLNYHLGQINYHRRLI